MFRKFFIRLTHWEYWPFSVLYFPVFFYYGWLALKNRSFFFFTSANPTISFGGMFGEKKSDIYKLLPDEYLPKTIWVKRGDLEDVIKAADEIGYPLIAKPNIGERGTWVKKIENQEDLKQYVSACPVDFLLQELIDYPVELGVFYVKKPGEKGTISSIVRKDFLKVIGDGRQTLLQLLEANDRAQLTANLSSDFLIKNGQTVPDPGQEVLIEPIGNHCRGTKFLNDHPQIDEELIEAFNKLADALPEFYFGRFDLKCQSYKDLKELKNFKIIELNGAGSEPGHIYQPGYPLWKAYRDILWHLRVLSDISALNRKRGYPYWSFGKGYRWWKSYRKYNRLLSSNA